MRLSHYLSQEGSLSRAISQYTPRESQQIMAEAIEKAIEHHSQLIIEAGTGTGKTFGYLIPIFMAEKKAIISTGTKNLQDQLYFKDIPVIKQLFSRKLKVVLLKGRSNYLCLYRLQRTLDDGRLTSREHVTHLHAISDWSTHTKKGDVSELSTVSEGSSIWPHVTSTVDNCLGQDCEFYKQCYVVKARVRAVSADILIVNHHLFFASLAVKEKGEELLPGTEVVVFDEAHQLPDIAAQFFSTSLSSREVLQFAEDCEIESSKEAKDMQEIITSSTALQKTMKEMRGALGVELRRATWLASPDPVLQSHISSAKMHLEAMQNALKVASVRSKGLENCWHRSVELMDRFAKLTSNTPENTAHWYENHLQSFTVQWTPLILAEHFKKHLEEQKKAWIFTSATLTIHNRFDLFMDTLGLENSIQFQLKSPFDYQKQALLYHPRGLPDTKAKHYTDAMIEAAIPVLEKTQGKAFILFTSFKALERAATILKTRISFPLLLQGSMPKRKLIDTFKKKGNAVLLGTNSFWFGVDVRGECLSCVIIDKLPFASPDDPILQAKIQLLRKKGMDPFYAHQLPNAVLMLKQGAGRLIRDDQDRGILMICDPRLISSHYGNVFIQSLPMMPRTRDIEKVEQFLASHETVS